MPDSEDPIRTLRRIAEDVGQVLDEARKSGSISFDNLCLLVPEEAPIVEIEERSGFSKRRALSSTTRLMTRTWKPITMRCWRRCATL